ncbi:MAG: DNA topoisomerase VI, partial [Nanoarchaeota archaeon]|nr:DNA topoisomerase VI [Nanoarchaeota archaeon]
MIVNNNVSSKIKEIASGIYKKILSKKQPDLNIPLRSLSNVEYNDEEGYFKLLGKIKTRTLTASTIKTFAQTLRMMILSKKLVDSDDIATKRETYYVSKNWGDARFKEQPESDAVMDDIEAMMMVNREALGFIPEEKGGAVAGKLIVIDQDPDTKKEIKIDCTKMGSGAYAIPNSVENLGFETNADFILAIETAGMHQRLVKHKYWKKANCILISMGGVPTRACRRFIRRLSDEHKLPVYVFTDCDFYGFMNIYRTLKVGSGNAA